MAIDRTLAERSADYGIIHRIYRWERPTLSFGANESAKRTWNREHLAGSQVAVVRRPTGGRGVWHDPADLTYAVTGPLRRWGDLRQAYQTIHAQLAVALASVTDDPVALAPPLRRPTLDPGACFDIAVGGEVLVAGRKTIGSAQAVLGQSLLQHGAIALADRSAQLRQFTLEAAATDNGSKTGLLADTDAVVAAIENEWSRAGALPIPAHVVDRVIASSEQHRSRFEDPAWTWRR
jgi:lipoyl(octanoyl) transferase